MEAEFFGSSVEIAQEALFVLLFIVGLALLDVSGAELEQAIEQACGLVSAGVNGGRRTQSSFEQGAGCRPRCLEATQAR